MDSKFSLSRLVEFRHEMHQNAEASFKEYDTQKRIKQYLLSIGIQEKYIKICAKTGLVVDLVGITPPQGNNRIIAFRADIDALVMQEGNPQLPYRSTNGCAHMCGHDGHTTCLLGFASLFVEQLEQIPSNKTIRLLFQPAEEQIGGAPLMIQEGCLNGVDEVYGFHQWPTDDMGQVWVKPGPMMSQPVIFLIKILGKGGHASEPHKFKNPVMAGSHFIQNVSEVLTKIQAQGKQFRFCFPVFNSGTKFNVIPDFALIEGMIRSLEQGSFVDELIIIITQALKQSTEKYGCSYELTLDGQNYPLTANSEKEAGHILRLGEEFFGKGNAHAGPCPVYASEDFGNYTLSKPGAFFFLSSGKKGDQERPMLHQTNFNFNDDLIEVGSKFWLRIAQDRLQLNEQK